MALRHSPKPIHGQPRISEHSSSVKIDIELGKLYCSCRCCHCRHIIDSLRIKACTGVYLEGWEIKMRTEIKGVFEMVCKLLKQDDQHMM